MIQIRRILCPIDFSESSRHALEHAVAVARWYDAEIAALHVAQVPVLAALAIATRPGSEQISAALQEQRARVEEDLHAWLDVRRSGVKTEAVVVEGDAAGAILDHAGSQPIDLIVMGTHGLGGFDRFLLGSVTEKVLRKASCPVLTVPPRSATSAKLPYGRVLCAVDFSEPSLGALRYALSLAQEAEAKITVLHVFDWTAEDDLLMQRFDVPVYRHALEDEAQGRLNGLITEDVRAWCTPTTKVAHGKPYREILHVADQESADVIVLGVRGRNALDLTLFGSTTNQVVRRATCPVLTVKP